MGTTWIVKYRGEAESEAVRQRVAERLEALEDIFSLYRPESELSRFNRARTTDWLEVSPELARVAEGSRAISDLTGGAFDATVAPLLALWGFGPKGAVRQAPSGRSLVAARQLVDYRTLEVRRAPPGLRKTRATATADFSSYAKGFAADQVSDLLQVLGLPDHLVQIGGDVKTRSPQSWRVGVEKPGAGLVATLELAKESALSTSGNHRNAVEREGRRDGHIIDPHTGRPVVSPVVSVSVIHTSCAQSSSLATGLYVMGLEVGMALAEREGLAVLFLVEEGGLIAPRASDAWLAITGEK
ncbi:MAG TPA: FAD:protein FMN transferase [Opitutaceae bacterium]